MDGQECDQGIFTPCHSFIPLLIHVAVSRAHLCAPFVINWEIHDQLELGVLEQVILGHNYHQQQIRTIVGWPHLIHENIQFPIHDEIFYTLILAPRMNLFLMKYS